MPRELTAEDWQRRAVAEKEFNELVTKDPQAVRLVAEWVDRNTMATYTHLCHLMKDWVK